MALNGEEVYIIKDENLSIQLVPCTKKKSKRIFGSAKGLIIMTDDFDEPLEDLPMFWLENGVATWAAEASKVPSHQKHGLRNPSSYEVG